LGIDVVQRRQVCRHRGSVAAGNRSGERRLTTLQRVLQRGAGKRSEDPFGQAAGSRPNQFLSD
jgi:hypothetical protein